MGNQTKIHCYTIRALKQHSNLAVKNIQIIQNYIKKRKKIKDVHEKKKKKSKKQIGLSM